MSLILEGEAGEKEEEEVVEWSLMREVKVITGPSLQVVQEAKVNFFMIYFFGKNKIRH